MRATGCRGLLHTGDTPDGVGMSMELLRRVCVTELKAGVEVGLAFEACAFALSMSRIGVQNALGEATVVRGSNQQAALVARAELWLRATVVVALDAAQRALEQAGFPTQCCCGALDAQMRQALRLVGATAPLGHGLERVRLHVEGRVMCMAAQGSFMGKCLLVFCHKHKTASARRVAKAAARVAELTAEERRLNALKTMAHNAERKKERAEWTNGRPPGEKGASRELKALRIKTVEATRAWEAAHAAVVKAEAVHKEAVAYQGWSAAICAKVRGPVGGLPRDLEALGELPGGDALHRLLDKKGIAACCAGCADFGDPVACTHVGKLFDWAFLE